MANKTNVNEQPPPNPNHAGSSYPQAITIDFDRYAEHLEWADPNDPDVRDLIQTLFHIVLQNADISWRMGPTKLACGQTLEKRASSGFSNELVLKSVNRNISGQFALEACDETKKGGRA